MKNFLFLLLSMIFAGGILISCNEDVDLIGDFQETAVVFGLLDQSDSLHYVKINRAFIGPGNALQFAQIPDSNYFNQIDATITEYINGSEIRVWTLSDTIIENKDPNGVFYAPFEKVYFFKTKKCKANGNQEMNSASASDLMNSLNKDATYKLNVSVNSGEFIVEGETALVSGITSPADAQTYQFDFASDPGIYTQKGLAANVGNSYVLNTSLEVKYKEYTSPSAYTFNTFYWNIGESDVIPNETRTYTINGQTFYDLIKSDVTDDASIIQRKMYSIKVIVTGGSEDMYNYMTVNQPSSSLAQSKPSYSNLTVSENHRAIGIFSSRYTHSTEKFYINPSNSSLRMMKTKTVAELCTGPITGNLYFCSQHIGDAASSYYCP